MKVYLAHSIATTAEKKDSIRVANEIRKLGFEVYAAAENNTINDKSNNPHPREIYEADFKELSSSDILVINLNGSLQDGTILELGITKGLNESHWESHGKTRIPIIAYSSNERVLEPQFYEGVASASLGHMGLGGVDKWGVFAKTETNMLETLKGIKAGVISFD